MPRIARIVGFLAIVCTAGASWSAGPDVIYTNCTAIENFGSVDGIRAYALGSHTCNIGDADLGWGGNKPLLAMNAYRLCEGRLEQIGMSWVKNGTFAAAGSGCGFTCNGNGGSVLGAGCRDIYGSQFNGSQGILGPRSQVNPFTGDYPGASGRVTTVIDKRLQIAETELIETDALFFVEGVYVAPDDAASGNALNNASYKRVTLQLSNFDLVPVDSMFVGKPAILAWRDHGLGVDNPDPSVSAAVATVPGEGRFWVASKPTFLGGGQWRYEYAIFNLNSHRSAGSFTVPIPSGTTVTNVGFHDVDYHTGEPYDATDWEVSLGAEGVTWSSPETFVENPDTNALRWGTMYNFWLDANNSPRSVTASIGLFRPGTPAAVGVEITGPSDEVVEFLRGDGDGDGTFNGLLDALFLLDFQFRGGRPPVCPEAADTDGDGEFNGLTDALFLLDHQFQGHGPPPPPYPTCGPDPEPATGLGCATNACG